MNKIAKHGTNRTILKEIFLWLFIFIVGSLIVTFLIDPESFNSFKSNIKDIIATNNQPLLNSIEVKEDPLINQCYKSINKCLDVAKTKYPTLSIKILKFEKFNDNESALKFFKTWSNPMQEIYSDIFLKDINYPVVLFSTRVSYDDIENPAVAICNSNGELTQATKIGYMC